MMIKSDRKESFLWLLFFAKFHESHKTLQNISEYLHNSSSSENINRLCSFYKYKK